MNVISEKTLVPLSLIAVLVGGIAWLTDMHFTSRANAKDIQEIKIDYKGLSTKLYDKVDEINKQLTEIKVELKKREK